MYAHHNMPFHEARAYIDRAWIKGRRSPLRHLEWLLISYPKYVLFGQAKKREFRFYRESYDECDRYVMLCDEYKDEIVRRLGLDPSVNKLRVIENYQTLPDRICYDKENIILYTGRLSYADKRLDRLIDAWSLIYGKLPDWKVLIVGDGKEKKNLEKKIRKAGLPRISLEGFSNDPGKYYEKASILALVSTYEGWPLSMTEAQANGAISSNVFASISGTVTDIDDAEAADAVILNLVSGTGDDVDTLEELVDQTVVTGFEGAILMDDDNNIRMIVVTDTDKTA